MSWPSVVAAICTYFFYHNELSSIVSWLWENGIPLNDWLGYIEVDNQLFPFVFTALITVLTLLQRPFGYALFCFMSILLAGGSTCCLIYHYFSARTGREPLLFFYWTAFILGWLTILLLIATALKVMRIDTKMASFTNSPPDMELKPDQTDEQ